MTPDDTPSRTILEQALGLACRAPSLHNSQPWRWIVESREVQLFADPDRIGRSTDRSGRELVVSCGAALDHLRVAMAASGWDSDVERFPNPNDPDHLATIGFTATSLVSPGQRERAEAIPRRRTDRLPFAPPSGWEAVERLLRQDVFDGASDGTAMLFVLGAEARPQLSEASRLSESLRRYDASYHAELQWWTTPTWVSQGLPPSALPSESERERVDVGRVFPARGEGDRRAEVVEDQSTIVVVATPEDSVSDALRCGEALSALLLECTVAGLATCTLTHMIELEPSREIVRGLLSAPAQPQLLVRVGTAAGGDVPPPTPRRPLGEVVEFRTDA